MTGRGDQNIWRPSRTVNLFTWPASPQLSPVSCPDASGVPGWLYPTCQWDVNGGFAGATVNGGCGDSSIWAPVALGLLHCEQAAKRRTLDRLPSAVLALQQRQGERQRAGTTPVPGQSCAEPLGISALGDRTKSPKLQSLDSFPEAPRRPQQQRSQGAACAFQKTHCGRKKWVTVSSVAHLGANTGASLCLRGGTEPHTWDSVCREGMGQEHWLLVEEACTAGRAGQARRAPSILPPHGFSRFGFS